MVPCTRGRQKTEGILSSTAPYVISIFSFSISLRVSVYATSRQTGWTVWTMKDGRKGRGLKDRDSVQTASLIRIPDQVETPLLLQDIWVLCSVFASSGFAGCRILLKGPSLVLLTTGPADNRSPEPGSSAHHPQVRGVLPQTGA